MDQSQQELRRAAAKAFQESLEQLGQSLKAENEANEANGIAPVVVPNQQSHSLPAQPAKEPTIDVKALEEAAADIEEFMRSKDCEPMDGQES